MSMRNSTPPIKWHLKNDIMRNGEDIMRNGEDIMRNGEDTMRNGD